MSRAVGVPAPWLLRVLEFAPAMSGRVYSPRVAPTLCPALIGAPFLAVVRDGRFVHADAVEPGAAAGVIVRAWPTKHCVLAVVALDTATRVGAWVHAGFRRLEAAGILRRQGVSLRARAQAMRGLVVEAIEHVASVDLVTIPGAGGCVLRSLRPDEANAQ